MRAYYPILEYDGSECALIEPSEVLRPVDSMPERCVLPIYKQVIDSLHAQSRLTHVTDISSSMGPFPVFKIDHEGHALARGTIVVPDAAVRDEGVSYHYVPAGREIEVDSHAVSTLESVVRSSDIPFRVGKTWTTDGLYRETRSRIARRRAEGCITVEMECSALLAVAQFRGVTFGQLLATGDDVSGDEWDPRRSPEHRSFPETLFWLAVECCLRL